MSRGRKVYEKIFGRKDYSGLYHPLEEISPENLDTPKYLAKILKFGKILWYEGEEGVFYFFRRTIRNGIKVEGFFVDTNKDPRKIHRIE